MITSTPTIESSTSEEGLKRVIGVPGLTLSIISGVVGAGIFALPGIVGGSLGAFGVFAYVICGLLMASIMLCYAEIGSRITTSGGSYAYVEAAFGGLAGYIINWLYFFGWSIIGSAALMNIVADSLSVLFPIFTNPFVRAAFFLILTVFMVIVNVRGARHAVIAVKLITIIKLIPLLGIILLGMQHVEASNLHINNLPSIKNFTDASLILFFAFAGFETSLGASGEIRNPQRTVPLSIVIAAITVLIIYMLLQAVVQGILGPELVVYKNAPLAAVAERIIGPVGATILLLCAALSCFGNVLLDLLCTPRSLFAAANKGEFPEFLRKVHHRYATPYMAIITYGALIFVFSVSASFQQLAVMASAIILLVYLAVILSTVKMRYNKPDKNVGRFKAPGGMITPIIGIVAIIWLLTSLSRLEILSTLIFVASVFGIFAITKFVRKKNGHDSV